MTTTSVDHPDRRRLPRRIHAALLFCALISLLLVPGVSALTPAAAQAAPATCTVTTTVDGGTGSLRGAVNDISCDSIDFDLPPNSVIALSGGVLWLRRPLTIDGSAVPGLTISGENQSRIFQISSRATVTLTHLTLANGLASYGGAIWLGSSSLNLTDSVLRNNNAVCADLVCDGGALYAGYATLSISDTEFTNNRASRHGGALVAGSSTLSLDRVRFSDNQAGLDGGAAILQGNTSGRVNLSQFRSNRAGRNGGGVKIYDNHLAGLTVAATSFSGNTAQYGGALYVQRNDALQILGGSFVSNTAQAGGGAITVVETGIPLIKGNTFTGNRAENGGALYVQDNSAAVEANQFSGNVATLGGGAVIVNSVDPSFTANPWFKHNEFTANRAGMFGGAVLIQAGTWPRLFNNLVAANQADIDGAGVIMQAAHVSLINNTIADQVDGDGLLILDGSTVTVQNNVIAGNRGGIINRGSSQMLVERNAVWGNQSNYQNVPFHSSDLNVDPLFVSAAGGVYYLSQVAAGQEVTSPLVDAGTAQALALGLGDFTTRSDGIPDSGPVDLGYHYATAAAANVVPRIFVPMVVR